MNPIIFIFSIVILGVLVLVISYFSQKRYALSLGGWADKNGLKFSYFKHGNSTILGKSNVRYEISGNYLGHQFSFKNIKGWHINYDQIVIDEKEIFPPQGFLSQTKLKTLVLKPQQIEDLVKNYINQGEIKQDFRVSWFRNKAFIIILFFIIVFVLGQLLLK